MSNIHFLTIGKFAQKLGVSTQTLRNWEKQGILKPYYKLPSGHRYYRKEQLKEVVIQGDEVSKDD